MLKIFIVFGSAHYANWIRARTNVEFVQAVEEADLLLFTGGPDVDPSLYGHEKYRTTYFDKDRDKIEVAAYKKAVKLGKPMLGICKGSQMLTALQPNGALIQDVTNHTSSHGITFNDEPYGEFVVTSTHHQMMYPFSVDNYELIASSTERLSNHYMLGGGANLKNIPWEPEIVFYRNTKCFCCQSHPEFMSNDDPFVEKLYGLVVNRLKLKCNED